MFALDADKGVLYYGVNGRWRNGQPGESGGDALGLSGGGFTPFVNISASSKNAGPEGDRWIANFGGVSFKYAVPATYGPYGVGGSARSMSSSAITPASRRPTASEGYASDSPVNKTFEDEVVVGGQLISLPPGKWLGLAYFKGAASSTNGDAAVFGKIDRNRLVGMVAVNAFSHSGMGNGFPAYKACARTDYIFVSTQSNDDFGPQRCWWINHASQVWNQSIFRAAKGVLDQRAVSMPTTLVNVGFRRANANGFATAFYYFNPEASGITSSDSNWSASEWHKDRIALDGQRVQYVKEMRSWGQSWAPVFYAMGKDK